MEEATAVVDSGCDEEVRDGHRRAAARFEGGGVM